MIMVGFRGIEAPENSDIYNTIKDVQVGGLALFDYDIPSHSVPRNITNPKQTKELIVNLQKYSAIPLFIAIDAEGGAINRLKQTYGFLPILSPEKMGRDKTLETTKKESEKLAQELKGLGFNMNFAPVVDVNINPKNPIIGALGRSFSPNSKDVVSQARVFIESHVKNNIIAVAKHFPGQGSATKDSHLGAVDVTNTYKKDELLPYQKLNNEGLLNAVMTAHIKNKNIDPNYPATLSSIFLQNILRKQIGFKGIIISDDMQMAAIKDHYAFDESIIKAVNAGNDVISFSNNSPNGYDAKIAYKVRDAIFNAVKEHRIKEERITESYTRILNLKKQFRITTNNFELLGAQKTLTFKDALDVAKYADIDRQQKILYK